MRFARRSHAAAALDRSGAASCPHPSLRAPALSARRRRRRGPAAGEHTSFQVRSRAAPFRAALARSARVILDDELLANLGLVQILPHRGGLNASSERGTISVEPRRDWALLGRLTGDEYVSQARENRVRKIPALHKASDVTLKLGRTPEITYHTAHEAEDWCVTLLDTGQETQTGGRLKRALPYINSDTFLFTYGDGLTNSDINASIEFHQQHGRIATVTAVKPSGRFGELAMDGQTITAFHEKPEKEAGFISGGFFVLEKRISAYIDADSTSLEKKPLERLAQERQIKAFCHEGFWQCMDTFREQEMLNKMWQSGDAPWKIW